MKKITQFLFCIFISLVINTAYASDNDNENKDRVLASHYFGDIAIIDVDTNNYDSEPSKFAQKIIIRKIVPSTNENSNLALKILQRQPTLGEVIWTITPQDLPVSDDACSDADSSTCEDTPSITCYSRCVHFGPEFLAYDSKRRKLYFLADTMEVGQHAGSFLGFVADIDKKEITYLKVFSGFAEGDLSPSGKYLILNGQNFITIYNTENGTEANIVVDYSTGNYPNEKIYYLGEIKWLSDTQFSYTKGTRHDKFQDSFDEKSEYIYDIPSQKIINSRVLSKDEFDSRPYVEPK